MLLRNHAPRAKSAKRTRRPPALLLLVRLILFSYAAGIGVLHGLRHGIWREDYTPVERGGCLSQAFVSGGREAALLSRVSGPKGFQQQSARGGATSASKCSLPYADSTARHRRATKYRRNAYYSAQETQNMERGV